ncbi:MAG: hypothetical protein H0U18_18065 [Pyrinomonadaceae bacterium]|nr:hypothetical protein [Pyrinomonadaceae bacterium]
MYQEQKVNQKGVAKDDEIVRGYFEIMNVAVTEFEFRNCITDHNLEDENSHLIDFTRPMQAWRLDPKVGKEIGDRIDELNQGDNEDLVPLGMPASLSLQDEPTLLSHTTDVK